MDPCLGGCDLERSSLVPGRFLWLVNGDICGYEYGLRMWHFVHTYIHKSIDSSVDHGSGIRNLNGGAADSRPRRGLRLGNAPGHCMNY